MIPYAVYKNTEEGTTMDDCLSLHQVFYSPPCVALCIIQSPFQLIVRNIYFTALNTNTNYFVFVNQYLIYISA